MKEVIILILLLTLFQTFVLLYCQNKNKYNNCKQTENYSDKNYCYKKDENGTYVLDKYGKCDSNGYRDRGNTNCYCNNNPDDGHCIDKLDSPQCKDD